MNDPVTWLIIAVFYAPLHYLIPVLVAVIRSPGQAERQRAIGAAVLDCTVSMTAAFALALWLADRHLALAMTILLLAMAAPYVRLMGVAVKAKNKKIKI